MNWLESKSAWLQSAQVPSPSCVVAGKEKCSFKETPISDFGDSAQNSNQKPEGIKAVYQQQTSRDIADMIQLTFTVYNPKQRTGFIIRQITKTFGREPTSHRWKQKRLIQVSMIE